MEPGPSAKVPLLHSELYGFHRIGQIDGEMLILLTLNEHGQDIPFIVLGLARLSAEESFEAFNSAEYSAAVFITFSLLIVGLRVYGIVLLMCSDELDKQDALAEQNLADEPVLVPANVENDSSPFENARAAILSLDVLRSLPGCSLRLMVPGLELLLAVPVLLPEELEPAPRDHSHLQKRIYCSHSIVK